MQIDEERLESLKATLMSEDDNISLNPVGKRSDLDPYYYITIDGGNSYWKNHKDNTEPESLSDEELLKAIKGKELEGEIWKEGEYFYYSDWEEYAKKIGVSKLVTLSVKIPEVIARRFAYFASDKDTKLRELIVEYVKKEWVSQAESLVFQNEV